MVLSTRLQARSRLVFGITAALVLICTLVTCTRGLKEDISVLIPTKPPQLAEQFSYLQAAPFMQFVTAALRCEGYAPESLAESFQTALRRESSAEIISGPGKAFSPESLARLCQYTPNLSDQEKLRGLEPYLTTERMNRALEEDLHTLLSPEGLAFRELVALDPLHFCPLLAEPLQQLQNRGGIRVRNGYFVDSTGETALIFIRPEAAMTDSLAAETVMRTIRRAVAALPEKTESHIAGSYRHSEYNATIIKNDLQRVLPISCLLAVLLFFLFIGRKQALSLLLVPFAAFSIAAAVSIGIFSGISGIVLGFGSVLLGITADYAIHVYFSLSSASDRQKGLLRVFPPLCAGLFTTATGFGLLLFSSIPALRQTAFFALTGLFAAFVFALLVLPLLLAPQQEQPEDCRTAVKPARIRLFPTAALTFFLFGVIFFAGTHLRFSGDIRSFGISSPEIIQDERHIQALQGQSSGHNTMLVATGANFEQALKLNEKIYAALRQEADLSVSDIQSLAPLFPSAETQQKNSHAWQAFWRDKAPSTWERLQALGAEHGFAANAFAPFKDWISSPLPRITPETLRENGLGLLTEMLMTKTRDAVLLYTMLPGAEKLNSHTRTSLEQDGAIFLSGETFRAEMASVAGKEVLLFSLLTFGGILCTVLLIYRSFSCSLLVLLPLLSGIAFIFTVFCFTGTAVNFFHGAAFPLVIALSVDYGIFMRAVLNHRLGQEAEKAVFFSALTTLAGFGCLLFAEHPALFSLGLTVSGGIITALLMAVWGLPLLVKKEARPL